MVKTAEIKEMIGINQNKMVLVYILVSAISFPFIFLGNGPSDFMNNAKFDIPFGIFYATVVTLGNVYIFYRRKKDASTDSSMKIRNLWIHLLFTALMSVLFSTVPHLRDGKPLYYIKGIFSFVSGSLLLCLILVGIYETMYYMRKFKLSVEQTEALKRANVESQMEILKNQVKPHFLFNSLNTLTSIIPENSDQAVRYVEELSKVYRYILEIKEKKLIPLKQEIDCVRSYLYMLNVRFSDSLRYEIKIDENDEQLHVVPLALQLLVENAVKHNVISKGRPLDIHIIQNGNGHVEVRNNLQLKESAAASTGTGLDNIKGRYGILTEEKVHIDKSESQFSVKIPVIRVL